MLRLLNNWIYSKCLSIINTLKASLTTIIDETSTTLQSGIAIDSAPTTAGAVNLVNNIGTILDGTSGLYPRMIAGQVTLNGAGQDLIGSLASSKDRIKIKAISWVAPAGTSVWLCENKGGVGTAYTLWPPQTGSSYYSEGVGYSLGGTTLSPVYEQITINMDEVSSPGSTGGIYDKWYVICQGNSGDMINCEIIGFMETP